MQMTYWDNCRPRWVPAKEPKRQYKEAKKKKKRKKNKHRTHSERSHATAKKRVCIKSPLKLILLQGSFRGEQIWGHCELEKKNALTIRNSENERKSGNGKMCCACSIYRYGKRFFFCSFCSSVVKTLACITVCHDCLFYQTEREGDRERTKKKNCMRRREMLKPIHN